MYPLPLLRGFQIVNSNLASLRAAMRDCGRRCVYCAAPLEFDLATLDHVHPIAHGGAHAPGNLVSEIHGLVFAGGSAFGLAAAGGVMTWLKRQGVGFAVGPARVPIVAGAILFDLAVGSADAWALSRRVKNEGLSNSPVNEDSHLL